MLADTEEDWRAQRGQGISRSEVDGFCSAPAGHGHGGRPSGEVEVVPASGDLTFLGWRLL